MDHYNFANEFRAVWTEACKRFKGGSTSAATVVTAKELAFLTANGITAQNMVDYAEDFSNYGEPSFETALSIELIRRDYFLNVQNSQPSTVVADPELWPAKTEAVRGIEWLPRIMPKARAKLRGELPSTLMYGCGGDRRFFKANNIQPSEFLNLVWRFGDNDDAIITWVERRAASGPAA